jgi:hypothetical protein
MHAIKGTVKDGRLEIRVPHDWPDGTEVVVQPVERAECFGMREEDWPGTPEASADWLQWYDSLEPLVFTAEERAAWDNARREQQEFEQASADERAEKLRRMWP